MYQTRAFVLAHAERGEADRMFFLYTEAFGLIRATAQGIRKPGAKLRGHLEILAETEIALVAGRSGYRLVGASLINPHSRILSSLMRRRAALALGEVVRMVSFEGKDPAVWETLAAFYRALDGAEMLTPAVCDQLLVWALTRLLMSWGYQLSHDTGNGEIFGFAALLRRYEKESIEVAAREALAFLDRELLFGILRGAFRIHLNQFFSFLTAQADDIMVREVQ